jgi:O-antigen/teichoic acid export membrane protein
MSQLKKGAILSYLNIVLTIVIGLGLTPFIIRKLGDSEYGLYTLIGSFVAYLSLMDLGLNNTIVRFVSRYQAQNDRIGECRFLGTTLLIYLAISIVVTIIGVVLYFNLDTIFSNSLTPNQLDDAKVMFLILVFNLAITLPGGSFTAICNAYERFIFPRVIAVVKYLLRAATVIYVLKVGGQAISLVIIDTAFNIAAILITMYFAYKKLKIQFDYSEPSNRIVKQIFSYSGWIFIFALVQTFQWNAGQVVLGMKLSTNAVAIYSVGIMLGSYYGAFASAINGVLLPRASQMVAANRSAMELTQTMIKVGRLNSILMLYILSGFFLFGREFIHLWVGDNYKDSWLIALLIMIVLTIPLTQSFGNSILEAKNKIAFRAITNLLAVLTGVVVGFFLSKTYGVIGMIIPIVSALLVNSVAMNFYFVSVFKFEITFFYREVFVSPILAIGLLSFVFLQIKSKVNFNNWTTVFVGIVIYTALYFLLSYFVLLDKNEKTLICYKFR